MLAYALIALALILLAVGMRYGSAFAGRGRALMAVGVLTIVLGAVVVLASSITPISS